MKPFDHVAVSSGEPRNNADVWIKRSKNFLNTKASYLRDTTTGITYKANNDGSITLNGTVTKPGSYTLLEGLNLKLKGNYTFSMKIISGTFSVQGVGLGIGNAENGGAYYSSAKGLLTYLSFRPDAGADFKVTKNINDTAMYFGVYFNKGTVFDNLTFTLQLENGKEATEYEQYLEPDILVKDNGVYNSILPKVIRNDISSTKTSKVTDVTRAIDNVWGKVHHINILCKVNNITTSDNVLFTTNIKAPYLTELYASNMQRVYRCLINESGQISLPSGTISTETLINISGTLII